MTFKLFLCLLHLDRTGLNLLAVECLNGLNGLLSY